MKTAFILLLFGLLVASTDASDAIKASDQWTLTEPAYGQFRLVPSKILPKVAEETKWNGPWGRYETFVVQVGFSRVHQTQPKDFEFFDPQIGLEGAADRARESHSTTVRLFNRASTPEDIEVTFYPTPDKVQLDQEYRLATVSGKDTIVSWDVFVRFTAKKPEYVREGNGKKESPR
ncbi:hypothetical protein ACXR0O_16835 [Verrucomicrobiota bacterium sgz303538]